MTEAKLRKLFKLWQHRLGLDAWHIEIRIDICNDPEAYMEVERSVDYQRARITVSPWMLGKGEVPKVCLLPITDDMTEESIVHELIHICTRDLVTIVRHDLNEMVHRDVHRVFDDAMTRADERCVDALAISLCRAFKEAK